ncbi:protein NEOXANTHIN-DEFICIENT 1-like isoform X2 [Andrographis paniculata]|uniref:protein NEOXANTHIN-DEFICIENT 1-like isoform X2 n=1 Tax=Andrographis paniculata TaxID=175694 RepID=UPI0021E78E5C|nr:protein NEOXANTHIN-DEFICIENT 1-like isoform X2 [Andrographis paniculata]
MISPTPTTTMASLQKPPSIFHGSGVYQMHLVKADVIRPFIPKEFKIVETLGYTMGGFMLTTYEDSPFGPFDELVMLAGIVSHSGSSLAWTGKALVSTPEVCNSSRKEFGIVTEVASFSKIERKTGGLLNMNGIGSRSYKDIHITETNGSSNTITIQTPEAPHLSCLSKFIITPPISLSLTSLSGLTEYCPRLLQYTCDFQTRVSVVATSKVRYQFAKQENKSGLEPSSSSSSQQQQHRSDNSSMRDLMIDIVMNKSNPIAAFHFHSMKMEVDSPTVVS